MEIASGDCIVTGWGTLYESGSSPEILQKVTIPVMDDKTCQFYMAGGSIKESMLCCGYNEGGKDSCQGDSGGPLYCNGVQAGIVSWGVGCARPQQPGIYTEVSYFVDWIKENIDN